MEEKHSSGKWLILLLAALIVIAAILGKDYFPKGILPGQEDTEKIQRAKTEEEIKLEELKKDQETHIKASQEGDSQLCESIKNESLKRACKDDTTITKAVEALDATLCESLSSDSLKTYCREKVERRKGQSSTEQG